MSFLRSSSDDYIEALDRLLVQNGDVLRRILQIAIHHHIPVRSRVIDARCQSIMLAEISTQLNSPNAGVALAKFLNQGPNMIGTAIVDQNDREAISHELQASYQALAKFS